VSLDLHTHTLVSDGELTPVEHLREAARRGISHLSITDHDSLGAYLVQDGEVFREAERKGVRLTIGIEMDAFVDGFEVHVLGFDLALDNAPLNAHLDVVERARAERARAEIGIVNALLGEEFLTESKIFVEGRRTLMKPHFIHPLLEAGRFPNYEEANAWFHKNVKSGVQVPKPSVAEVLSLIRGAGGWSALAHPGYYEEDGLDVPSLLKGFKEAGLDGLEVYYPYHSCSPHKFTAEAEEALIRALGLQAETLGLRLTRGSDSHTRKDFERVYAKGVWA
jgi:predicted metal-dependent phosphoesterase TrpH